MKITTVSRSLVAAVAVAVLFVAAPVASAAGPAIELHASIPEGIRAGGPARMFFVVENVGDAPLSGDVTLVNVFPDGIAPVASARGTCEIFGQTVTCTQDATGLLPGAQVRFPFTAPVSPDANGALVDSFRAFGGRAAEQLSDHRTMTVGTSDPFSLKEFTVRVRDTSGGLARRAGSNPSDLTTSLAVPTVAETVLTFPVTAAVAQFKDVIAHVPAGLVGNPTSTPTRCTSGQLTRPLPFGHAMIPNCPLESQVGVVRIAKTDVVPLYNMEPPIGTPAAFGFTYQSVPIVLVAKLRPSDNGIDIVAVKAASSVPVPSVAVTLWGVPSDSSHDTVRERCLDNYEGNNGLNCPSGAPRRAFLRLPTSCPGTPLVWGAEMNSYLHPETFVTATTTSPGIEGCQVNPFAPTLAITPTDQVPHAATGLDATLAMPQDVGPDGIAPADVRTVTAALPEGLTINPSSANGLRACVDSDLRIRQEGPASCPDASKLGTVALKSPLLDHQIGGSIYLRPQDSDDPASGELFRIAIELRSDSDGIFIRLPGAVRADPATGRLTATFDDLPQLPFSSMRLHFDSGPRASLVSPRSCGTHTATAMLTSWADRLAPAQSVFSLSGDGRGAACAGHKFSPAFRAGVENPLAGRSSPFHVSLSRDDGDELFEALAVRTPRGLLGRIKDAELCLEAVAKIGTCSETSRIGSAATGAGAGPNPFFITNGRVFLTGPYRGAPYGLSVVVDAVAGPFRLGTVVVRAAIHVDRRTAQLKVVSDPFPTILKGVPLNLRAVRIGIDKPNFMVSPTNCSKQRIEGTATSTDGTSATVGSRFQVGSCRSLRFAPRISMRVGARGRTGFRSSTPLTTTIRQAPGQSNLGRVKVTLPNVLSALLPVVDQACSPAEFESGRCRQAEIGTATAVTPLLKDPLRGAAYFVRPPGQPLPNLVIALRGDVDLDVSGRVTIPHGKQLATDFAAIPDAPISKFTLRITAGRNGPLGVSSNLCGRRARRARASITMEGQNGTVLTKHPRLNVVGCGAGQARR